MANTTVTDALLMANVTKSNAGNNKKSQADGVSFAAAMSDATSVKTSEGCQPSISKAPTETESSKRETVKATEEVNNNRDASKVPTDENSQTTTETGERDTELAKGISDKAAAIKDIIKEKLGVSDEEIEAVMANMGYLMGDLLNPDALKNLMMELTGIEDSMALLTDATAYEGFVDVLGTAKDAATELAQQAGITPREVIDFAADEDLMSKAFENAADINIAASSADAETVINSDSDALTDLAKPSDSNTATFKQRAVVEVIHDDSTRTETFKNVAFGGNTSEASDNESAMMQNPTATVVTTTNELGQIVETVESFSNSFSSQEEILSQVTQSIRLNISADTTSMELMLHPASLGTVNMQVSSQGGVVTAHLLVQNDAVKGALEAQLTTLVDTLREQGQQVEAVEVSVANYDLNRGMNGNNDERERENAFRSGRAARRRLNLDEIGSEDEALLDDGEKIAADMMRRQGNSLDYMA